MELGKHFYQFRGRVGRLSSLLSNELDNYKKSVYLEDHLRFERKVNDNRPNKQESRVKFQQTLQKVHLETLH
jgi:hypothetical protein